MIACRLLPRLQSIIAQEEQLPFQKDVLSYNTVVALVDMLRHVIMDSVIFSSDGSGIAVGTTEA